MNGHMPADPVSPLREVALPMRELFLAYRQVGFTAAQAMELLVAQIHATTRAGEGR